MRRPSFQFYPADWRNNANLRRCSPAARGIWVDVMCVLHDSDEYGLVRWPLIDLANSANAPIKLVRELVDKNVLKGGDKSLAAAFIYVPRSGRKNGPPVTLLPTQGGPIWFSSRMVKDEYVRTIRGESTRFGDDNGDASKQSPKDAPKPPFGDGSTSSSTPTGSVPTGTDGVPPADPPVDPPPPVPPAPPAPPAPAPKSPEEMAKAELWRAAVSVLEQGGCPPSQCRTFMGKLVKDHGFATVQQAVAAAVAEQPADAREYLKAACQHSAGQRQASEPAWRAEQRERTQQAAPGVAIGAAPADQFFIEVEARRVVTNALD